MFLSKNTKVQVGPDGDPKSSIAIIGEAPGAYELREGRPFVGPAGSVFEQCLHNAGLIRSNVYVTNLIKEKVNSIAPYYNERTKRLSAKGEEWADALRDELESVEANIVIPLGNAATAALTGSGGVMQKRGYITEALPEFNSRKTLPTIHPSAALRGNYLYRHFITSDFRKASTESESPDIHWPEVQIDIPNDFGTAKDYLNFLATKDYLSVDIEVMNFEVSCIGFCYEDNKAIVIPMQSHSSDVPKWSLEEEIELWTDIAWIMEDPDITKLGQNFIFDMQFMLQKNHIITRGWIDDTMIMNSLTLPDFPKGLEFLVSIHCNRPRWKDMVHWKGSDLVKRDN